MIFANVIFRNTKLIDACVKIKRVYKTDSGNWDALIGVAQTEQQAKNGSFLYDFIVNGGSETSENYFYALIEDKFKKEGITFRLSDDLIAKVPDNTTVSSDKPIKPKKTRKKKDA